MFPDRLADYQWVDLFEKDGFEKLTLDIRDYSRVPDTDQQALNPVQSSVAVATSQQLFQRRLPIYLLLDCSAAMAGEPLESMRRGVKALLSGLRNDPQALETVCLSIITFGDSALQTVPLTELVFVPEPIFESSKGEGRVLGAALNLLGQRLQKEYRKATMTSKGDWLPIVVLFIAGAPTDLWDEAAQKILKQVKNFTAIATGPWIDSQRLKKMGWNVHDLHALQPGALANIVKWVSAGMEHDPPPPQIATVP